MNEMLPVPMTGTPVGRDAAPVPALIAAAGERPSIRFLEFFAANKRDVPHQSPINTWLAEKGRFPLTVASRP